MGEPAIPFDDERSLPHGLYESVVTTRLAKLLGEQLYEERPVDQADVADVLSRYLSGAVRRAMGRAGTTDQRVALAAAILNAMGNVLGENAPSLDDELSEPVKELLEVRDRGTEGAASLERPSVPLGANDVLMNLRGEARIGAELQKEIASADRVDLVCSFLIYSGFRLLRDALASLVNRGGSLRVLTTTYMGVTERRVLDELIAMGAEVRVAYGRKTKLHAKAWILGRETGYTTAFVGSSNLSHSAMIDGLEWNVRLSAVKDPDTVGKIEGAFSHYWGSEDFEPFEGERFAREKRSSGSGATGSDGSSFLAIDLGAFGYQQRILDELLADREVHGHQRSLVVAATGTGKTVIAALDYAREKRKDRKLSLLFLSHRKEISLKSRATFRHALRDPHFGELLGDGERPASLGAVFGLIQSLTADRLATFEKDQFDWIIVDEFHHAAAATYRAVLEHFEPKFLLGLTATPERADGISVQDEFFEGRITSEVRLWDALDRGLLSPFHYFGVDDGMDLSKMEWGTKGYAVGELATQYIGHHQRLNAILRAVYDYVPDPQMMRAVGFCVSIEHADWMAAQFRNKGIKAASISGKSSSSDRAEAQRELEAGTLQALFVVDLLNEGVDIPSIDTILFLRPTDSPVLFVQQLGRGLRLVEDKRCLTVLDFIGRHHKRFRIDRRFAAITKARTRREIEYEIKSEALSVPVGCEIVLERQAQSQVLDQLRESLDSGARSLARELRELGPETTLAGFLDACGLGVEDIYRGESTTWTNLRRRAGFEMDAPGPSETALLRALSRTTHLDDLTRLEAFAAVGAGASDPLPSNTKALVYVQLNARSGTEDLAGSLRAIAEEEPEVADEIRQLVPLLRSRLQRVPNAAIRKDIPLSVHGTYSLFEISAALGYCEPSKPSVPREGVLYVPKHRIDAFFITVNKSERAYSPATMYRDYAIGRDRFHWESQNSTSPTSPTGRRYIDPPKGHEIWLFARAHKKAGAGAAPYTFLGPCTYMTHRGSRPIAFEWQLSSEIPADLLPSLSL
jgi:superfamily II DNA or RNA helicase/HKD family nuclease